MRIKCFFERCLARWAKRTMARERPFVIAVTGSVGKTTTRQAIATMLQAGSGGERVRASEKNYNNELGLPCTIFDAEAPGMSLIGWIKFLAIAWMTSAGIRKTGVRTFVLEMGADHPGDLAKLVEIAQPDIAVVTAVTPDDTSLTPVHTANFSSIEALADEKATVVKAVKQGGAAVLNADDKRVFSMRHMTHAHISAFGESDAADVRLVKTRVTMDGTEWGNVPKGLEIMMEILNRVQVLTVPGVFGRSVAYAACAAAAVAEEMDLSYDTVMRLDVGGWTVPGRVRIIVGIKRTTLFDDSYNASPASVLSALRDLGGLSLTAGQRRVACLGEMRELGESSERMHRMMGAETAKQGIDLLVCCGIFARAVADGARANGMKDAQIILVQDAPEAGIFLQDWIGQGDIILVKGSEGPLPGKSGWGKVTGVRMDRVVKELMAEPLRARELLCRQEGKWRS